MQAHLRHFDLHCLAYLFNSTDNSTPIVYWGMYLGKIKKSLLNCKLEDALTLISTVLVSLIDYVYIWYGCHGNYLNNYNNCTVVVFIFLHLLCLQRKKIKKLSMQWKVLKSCTDLCQTKTAYGCKKGHCQVK